jgi:hypothetical protein
VRANRGPRSFAGVPPKSYELFVRAQPAARCLGACSGGLFSWARFSGAALIQSANNSGTPSGRAKWGATAEVLIRRSPGHAPQVAEPTLSWRQGGAVRVSEEEGRACRATIEGYFTTGKTTGDLRHTTRTIQWGSIVASCRAEETGAHHGCRPCLQALFMSAKMLPVPSKTIAARANKRGLFIDELTTGTPNTLPLAGFSESQDEHRMNGFAGHSAFALWRSTCNKRRMIRLLDPAGRRYRRQGTSS